MARLMGCHGLYYYVLNDILDLIRGILLHITIPPSTVDGHLHG